MEIPRLRFVESGGPIAPTPSISAAAAPGKAAGAIGDALQSVGETGLRIAEQMRETKEAGIMSAWRSNADERANEFSNSLMSRQDPENWTEEWAAMREEIGAGLDGLGLSPVAKQRARLEFDDWASGMGNRFSTQAAVRQVSEGKARWSNAVNYYASRGDDDGMRREIERGKGFIPESELEEVAREADRIRNRADVSRRVAEAPAAALEEIESEGFLDQQPGMTEADRVRLADEARRGIEDNRRAQMDVIELAIEQGTLHPRDIEAATYLTEQDRARAVMAMQNIDPPNNETHGKAWELLWDAREAFADRTISDADYAKKWNETRAEVLGMVPPRYAGDIKAELQYRSPANRAAVRINPPGYNDPQELKAMGYAQLTRARKAGLFGDVSDSAPPAEKEKAYRQEARHRTAFSAWLRANPEASAEEVEAAADQLITGDLATTAATELRAYVPGSGRAMLPPVRSTGRQQKADADAQLLEGDPGMSGDILPAKELDDFLTK